MTFVNPTISIVLWVFFARVEYNQIKRSTLDDRDPDGFLGLKWSYFDTFYNPQNLIRYLLWNSRMSDSVKTIRFCYFALPTGLLGYLDFWNGLDLVSLALIFLTYAVRIEEYIIGEGTTGEEPKDGDAASMSTILMR